MTGSGKSIFSRMTGAFSAQRVSPVMVSLRPPMATMSPARAILRSSRELACISIMRPTRSRFCLLELYTYVPLSSAPL